MQDSTFNLLATAIFGLAILHTFFAPQVARLAHHVKNPTLAMLVHYLGEVELIFGIWAILLLGSMAWYFDIPTAVEYIHHRVVFTEALFVFVVMAMAATRPVLFVAERLLGYLAAWGKSSVSAWWLVILGVSPFLGSFITEPAAMTVASLLLAKYVYVHRPTLRFAYATFGLLLVNISVGGALTHYAAPPILMVAQPWQWDTAHVFMLFGWKAILGVAVATGLYFALFRKELQRLDGVQKTSQTQQASPQPIPWWVIAVHILFLAWTVLTAHYPELFIGGFIFFLGFMQATDAYQNPLHLRAPLLVSFFIAGLVIHGGLQGWWISPLLEQLSPKALLVAGTVLTAFNDNAAVTYLSTLVQNFSADQKYAVVAGAITGGGLTLIANAPNPVALTILNKFFPNKTVGAGRLALAALIPTGIFLALFSLL